jgi:hypothetical protein
MFPFPHNSKTKIKNKRTVSTYTSCRAVKIVLEMSVSQTFSFPALSNSIFGSRLLLLNFGCFFSFLILYTVGRDSLDRRSARRKAATYTQNAHIHLGLGFDSNPRTQCSSERRELMPQAARPLWSATLYFYYFNYNLFKEVIGYVKACTCNAHSAAPTGRMQNKKYFSNWRNIIWNSFKTWQCISQFY